MIIRSTIYLLGMMYLFSLGSCLKEEGCNSRSISSEEPAMQTFATANSINTTRHSSGLYYEVTNPGTGTIPTINSTVSVRYVGKLLNGTVFDSQTTSTVTFPLSGVIAGWQIGIPLIAKGGSIKLIIPSALAYGCNGVGTIPPDSILYFEVDLVDVL